MVLAVKAHFLDQVVRVGEVGIGVPAAEVGERGAVDHGARRRAQAALEDLGGVRPGDGVHGVEAHAEAAARQQRPNGGEVEERLHERGVVGDGVDDLHGERPQRVRPRGA